MTVTQTPSQPDEAKSKKDGGLTWQLASLPALVLFSLIFLMGSATYYGLPLLSFMVTVGDYLRAFLANLPFVLVIAVAAIITVVVLAVLLVIVLLVFGALLMLALLGLLLPMLIARSMKGKIAARVATAILLYLLLGAVAFWLLPHLPQFIRWIASGIDAVTQEIFDQGYAIMRGLLGYPGLEPEYFSTTSYQAREQWENALEASFIVGYVGAVASSFIARREEVKALFEDQLAATRAAKAEMLAGRIRAGLELLFKQGWDGVGRVQLWMVHAISLKNVAWFIPTICVLIFAAGAIKGRLDVEQGREVTLTLDGTPAQVCGLMVAQLEKGILIRNESGSFTLYSWDTVRRVDIEPREDVAAPAVPAPTP